MVAEEYDGRRELRVAAGMVMSTTVLSKLVSLPRRDWSSSAMRAVDRMCCRYFDNHVKAPKKSIVDMFASWSEKAKYKDEVASVEQIIQQIIQVENVNALLCIDEAMALFAENRATHGMDVAKGLFAEGKVDEGLRTLAEAAEPIKAGTSSSSSPIGDKNEYRSAFAESSESIIKFSGGLGHFFGDMLEEDGFISFLAPQGRGKSFFLLEMAYTAMLQRKKVAYFQIGDMTKKQICRRLYSRAAKWPLRSPSGKWPCKVKWPAKLALNGVDYDDLEFDRPLDAKMANEACERIHQEIRSSSDYFLLSCHESMSLSIKGVGATLREMSRGGFEPQVVCLDYADNLLPVNHKIEVRHQIHQTWELMRALSMENHILLVTATQSTRQKYGKDGGTIRMDSTSEDIRKAGAVTGLVGINQDDNERASGLYRLNWADKTRDAASNPRRFCFTASCLPVANPAVLSIYPTYDEQKRARA